LIVGGDLNCSTQLPPPDRQRHANLFDRIASLGLIDLLERTRAGRQAEPDCPCDNAPNCGHVRTHKHRMSDLPWQDDYLFATPTLAERLTTCYAVHDDDPDPWSLSDHCPVVAVFDL
jgi:hypothetical protein